MYRFNAINPASSKDEDFSALSDEELRAESSKADARSKDAFTAAWPLLAYAPICWLVAIVMVAVRGFGGLPVALVVMCGFFFYALFIRRWHPVEWRSYLLKQELRQRESAGTHQGAHVVS